MAIDSTYRNVEEQTISIMKDVFGPVLNRDVEISIEEMEEASADSLQATFPELPVVIEIPIESTTEGSLYFFCSQKLAAAITDLMVMGDGTADFDEHESLDGVAEATNQIVGAQSTFWTEELQVSISFGNAQGRLQELADFDAPLGEMIEVKYNMSISDWGEEPLVKLIPKGVLELISSASGGEGSVEQEMAQAGFNAAMGGGSSAPSHDIGMPQSGGSQAPQQTARSVQFDEFEGGRTYIGSENDPKNLDLLMDISLPVTIELGRTQMLIKDVLEIGPGSVIELQKLSGEPVDLYINEKRFALGEVVVIDENFGIRITELLSVEDRIKALK